MLKASVVVGEQFLNFFLLESSTLRVMRLELKSTNHSARSVHSIQFNVLESQVVRVIRKVNHFL